MKKILFSAVAAVLAFGASAALPKDVRIYINPGHGSWGGEDRHLGTVTHGAANYTDTAGFYESNTNLEKGFGMLEKLIEYGMPFDRNKNLNNSNAARRGAALDLSQNVVMSRVKNGPYPHDGSTYGAYSRPLSEIATEAEINNFDMFISIHSNANVEGTNTNFPIYLYRGTDAAEGNAGSVAMAKASWPHWIKNKHMMWTAYTSGTNIRGDISFWNESYTTTHPNGKSYSGYYGVLRQGVPGFLVEGYFHTYQPARHKAMNWDACRWEGEAYAKGVNDYFGFGKKDSYGTIYGVLRDGEQTFSHTYYTPNTSTLDKWKPINNATVTLKNSSGQVVQTYKTDDEYNGVFVFNKVPAGTYTLTYSHPDYREFSQSVTVTANETVFPTPLFETEQIPARGHYAYGLSSTNSGSNYTLKFKSTGDVDNASIIFTNNSTGVKQSIKTGAIKKGENTVTVDAKTLGENAQFSWSVAIDNPVSTGVELLYSDNSIVYNNGSANARIGVAIDKDQTSANFGTIYTMTAMGQGLQKYNPDFSKNGGKLITNMFGQDASSSTSSYKFYRSNRIEVNRGNVYIANYAGQNPGVWVYNPTTGATPTLVSGGTYYERAIAFYGEGTSRKAFGSHNSYQNVQRFDIGNNTSWTSGSPSAYYVDNTVLQNGDGDIVVTDNAVIVSQNRYAGNNQSANPAFAVLDHNMNLIYKSDAINSTLNGSDNGGMALTADKKRFAIANSYQGSGNSGVIVQVYDVTWNGSTPTFVHKHTIPLDGTYQVDQMEFDHADNLVIASQQKGLLVYAIKNPARQTVTKATSTIQGQAMPAVRGHYAYGLKMSQNGNKYTLTFKSTGAVESANVVLKPATGEATKVKINNVKAGDNSVEIDATTLETGVKYTWSIAFDNPASPSVELYHSDNSIIYNNGTKDARIGLTIDNDQTSANFGTVYTLTAMGQGLQKYNPDLSKNGSKVITGMFGKDTDASTSTNKFVRSNRLEVEKGKLYIANYANQNSGMWEYDPATGAAPKSISGGVLYERCLDFYGEGSSRKVFTNHENNVQRFDIGTNTTWTSGSANKNYTTAGVLDNGDGDIIVTNNAVIVSQTRYAGNNLTNNPAFAVFDHDLNLKFKSDAINATLNGSENGGMAISADYKTFAIADSYTGSGRSGVSIQVYDVTWNGATPTFTHKYAIPLDGTHVVDQMEFDYAGNLLIASQQKGLLAYAVKTAARTTTTNANASLVIEGVQAPLYITGENVGGNWDPANAAQFDFDGTNYTTTVTEATTEFKISTAKGEWAVFNEGNLAPDAAITNGGTVNLSVNKDAGNIVLPWAGAWTITVAGDLSTLTATTETPEPVKYPAAVYVVGHDNAWNPEAPLEIAGENGVYTAEAVEFSNTTFKLSTAKGSWDDFNAAGLNVASNPVALNEDVALTAGSSQDITIKFGGTYNVKVNLVNNTLTLTGQPNYPEVIYAIGNVDGAEWSTSTGVAFSHKADGVYEGTVNIDNADSGYGYFQFTTILGDSWDAVNAGTRYGATENNQLVEANIIYPMTNNWAGGTQSWKCAEGKCDIQVDIVNCTMQIMEFTGIESIVVNGNSSVKYYNLQGVEIEKPSNGVYIKVNGSKATRVYVK